jgi:hypothetical protein
MLMEVTNRNDRDSVATKLRAVLPHIADRTGPALWGLTRVGFYELQCMFIFDNIYVGTMVTKYMEGDPQWFLRATLLTKWLRYCATKQKVAGSIPDGVMEFFIHINHSDRTMALGSTQPIT